MTGVRTRGRRRLAVVAGTTLGALVGALAFAVPAAAHVTVDPSTAARGSYARVVFRVPNESDTANTVRVEVNLPADTPIPSVRTKPVPGWKATLTPTKLPKPVDNHGQQITEAVTRITWQATGAGIAPGEFEEFPVSLGPLPDTDKIVFKTLQAYSDGEVVSWIDEPSAGSEPANPAPVLTLSAGESPGATPSAEGTGADDGGTSGSSLPLVLSLAGLAAALAALLLAGLAYSRTRASTPDDE